MKTPIVLTLAILAQAIGNTCLSKGMKNIAALSSTENGFFLRMILHAMGDPTLWLGTLLLILFFILFAAALSWADLSFVIPVISFGYIVNVALAHQFLDEPVSSMRWLGTGFIFLGVILVSRTGSRRTAAADNPIQRSPAR
ncbi:EamA family transporter [Desulforhabdus sp. TSK]|uniref:EamA family transporter n=1 Tax=Desulforhabdus sp. TSK TaxID=2925014 RepID=UPI001FC7D97B|nr:EamA family transporter [Desulforhabdus sp. TSK]GKT08290.1 hypothetical protein DSTSK_15950 [Desulforhabdus sp. TSK]